MNTLLKINDKLEELRAELRKLYPKFYITELKYTQARGQKLRSQEILALGNQNLRENEVDILMSDTKEYEEYHKLFPELYLLKQDIMILTQESKNIIASQWEGVK